MHKLLVLSALLAPLILTACGSGAGTALAALGASAVTAGGSFALSAAQEDIAEAAEWRAGQKALVAQITAAMIAKARDLEDDNWDAALALYKDALAFNEEQQPKILLERLRERIEQNDARLSN